MSRIRFFIVSAFAAGLLFSASLAFAQDASGDPPDRVARLAYSSGDVEFAPAGENDWGTADVNRPLVTGDRLLTGDDGRAALEMGGAALRIDHGSAFNFLDLNDTTAQVELSQGALNLRVSDVGQNQTYEIDTPTVAFVASQPGTYRVDVAPGGNGAMVTVFDGSGTVYGENGASRQVESGQSYRFNDSALSNVEVAGLPSPDDFDRWAQSRDNRYEQSVSRRYVSPEVIGYDDLDQYGAWNDTPEYGAVWYPTQVYSGWAPYRDGHWAWIDPWGWTWVDDAPWGFAPFHYGRWVYVGNRWGWCPGQRAIRPVYAPALVAFVGGSGFSLSISLGGGGPVGWFPLGPRDIYVPPYRASRNYFTSINVTNIRNVYVNNTVINNYYGNYVAQRPMNEARYAYRNDSRAFTAVPRNVFTGAKPVRNAVLHVPPRSLAQAQVMPTPRIAPTQASLAIKPPSRPIATPARAFDRTVVAKHAPPPRPVPFAARERVIARQGGTPVSTTQLQQMRQQQASAKQPQRVQVVAANPKTTAPLPPMKRVQNLSTAANNAPVARNRVPAPNAGRNPPEPVHANPSQPHAPAQPPVSARNPVVPAPHANPLRPGELPSARFAHPDRGAPNPAAMQQRNASNPAQQHALQSQQAQQRAQNDREQARFQQQQAQQHAAQAQQAQQRDEQARFQQQQAQQREAQANQRDQQMRAQQAQQAQQQAKLQQQRADQVRQQQEAQQRDAQARQRDAQMRAQQEQQRAQQEQQRAQQARMQQEQARQQQAQQQQMMMQQRQAQEAQMRAMQAQQAQQRAEQMRAQQQQHAPPPPPPQSNQPPPKKKDHDQQDNGH